METKPGSKLQLQTLLRQAGLDFPLGDRFYRKMVLSMNGTKGRTGEFLVFAAVLHTLRAEVGRSLPETPKTQHVIKTPNGVRRIDLYFPETRFAIEIKSGYVRATRDFRKQVSKDVWLLQNRTHGVSEVMWIFLRGASAPARRYLDERRIAWMDMDLEQMRPPTTSDWPDPNQTA